jgi:hypothetical protein
LLAESNVKATIQKADCLDWLRSSEDDSFDLVFGSPPYQKARKYLENGLDLRIARSADEWVQWMVEVFVECQRVCKGLVAFVVAGQTKAYRWNAAPALLAADLHRAGLNLRNPPIYCRCGIFGSGGPDWLRADYEWIICTSRGGRLPWSDNTACGHPPKWAPGGEMSDQLSDGEHVNQWGRVGSVSTNSRGQKQTSERGTSRPSHVVTSKKELRRGTRGTRNGDTIASNSYKPPVMANPGNLIKIKVGGNLMGSDLAHLNEAPFSEWLADFFVRSFCPPGGIVADPFAGSGTVAAAAIKSGRNFAGCDLRQSQVGLTTRRIAEAKDSVNLF